MRNLTVEDVTPIYRRNYWERCRCQDLPDDLDWAVMDWSVNSGNWTPQGAGKLWGLMRTVQSGTQTLMLVSDHKPADLIDELHEHRETFYRELSTFETFGRGWLRRNDETKEQSLELLVT